MKARHLLGTVALAAVVVGLLALALVLGFGAGNV